jgi:hypothetical protein
VARQVLRYRSTCGTAPYAAANIQLIIVARALPGLDFEWGPVSADRMQREGLTVTGESMEALDPVVRVLGGILHLHRTGDWMERD